ncbi:MULTISPECIES: helix-turn-helix domain-containing protein [Cyanophyceae]|uniref:winged helix-turn-helix transcriptional regulator n=1 Tax=Cyanophyceae TaxID=3028117 RepID=UPI001688DFD8|nr:MULTISPECIES: helix-turn-helix domain-containing protein [Cyanophyceae]MBD1915563.1 helix-turn-helix transcriptional regulator [Phormidium sp. FACHB-77]MBD2031873.1 helix-turn-helix transcriptional regulator [Phormidium sp. FACHB-322]MBD2050623.1 helix-turn-helix transcriptional regulator [Leptolyngbya sp. FACHB-60]
MARLTNDRNSCPVSVLMNLLSGPWTMYIIWRLSTNGPMRFGALRRQVEGISTKMLTERLRMLEQEGIVDRHYEPTVPPQVTYSLTERAGELVAILDQLNGLAQRWYGDLPSCEAPQAQTEALEEATVLL